MGLISLIVVLVIVGVILAAVNAYIPMDAKIKQILNIAVVIAVVLWLLAAFGVLPLGNDIRIGNAALTALTFIT